VFAAGALIPVVPVESKLRLPEIIGVVKVTPVAISSPVIVPRAILAPVIEPFAINEPAIP